MSHRGGKRVHHSSSSEDMSSFPGDKGHHPRKMYKADYYRPSRVEEQAQAYHSRVGYQGQERPNRPVEAGPSVSRRGGQPTTTTTTSTKTNHSQKSSLVGPDGRFTNQAGPEDRTLATWVKQWAEMYPGYTGDIAPFRAAVRNQAEAARFDEEVLEAAEALQLVSADQLRHLEKERKSVLPALRALSFPHCYSGDASTVRECLRRGVVAYLYFIHCIPELWCKLGENTPAKGRFLDDVVAVLFKVCKTTPGPSDNTHVGPYSSTSSSSSNHGLRAQPKDLLALTKYICEPSPLSRPPSQPQPETEETRAVALLLDSIKEIWKNQAPPKDYEVLPEHPMTAGWLVETTSRLLRAYECNARWSERLARDLPDAGRHRRRPDVVKFHATRVNHKEQKGAMHSDEVRFFYRWVQAHGQEWKLEAEREMEERQGVKKQQQEPEDQQKQKSKVYKGYNQGLNNRKDQKNLEQVFIKPKRKGGYASTPERKSLAGNNASPSSTSPTGRAVQPDYTTTPRQPLSPPNVASPEPMVVENARTVGLEELRRIKEQYETLMQK
ncbi:hypothetical protein M406DRAFT_330259 [Cryphonectria parasitica EP155]|uniref:Uncharacterized protein n=1 Tax=Cryphonectria parasitica (strain ATCC 38755 / EP155) TaxID=660469 RepID=A0A9P4Y4R2_CRYP1|nr:uncharacterized protein M406DRAFT_330259 [Cryphonectria parasitica EP155]KAF3766439.1 hypothetical protein M406DRAFT_330259 [Cryphonectria parasitica EP155]